MRYRIVETDNFGGDYPDEKFVNVHPVNRRHAEAIAAAINSGYSEFHNRHYKVVEDTYTLVPGFEP